MIIRPEIANDCDSIQNILITAFADHPHSHQTEHLIVDALRTSDALTVSLVAEIDGSVVGHIAFSPVKINGIGCKWFALGPVAVLPGFQRQGIGRGLIEEGLKTIRSLAAEGCVLVGDPDFYCRFGFHHNPALVLEGIPPDCFKYFMCLPMTEQTPEGHVTHHSAFSVGL